MHYYTMWHKGGLKEACETIWEITERNFNLLEMTMYEYYGYDERIKAHRFILKDIEHNLGMPTWLLKSEEELY